MVTGLAVHPSTCTQTGTKAERKEINDCCVLSGSTVGMWEKPFDRRVKKTTVN